LDPVDPETRERLRLETPHGLLQTFTDYENYDIRRGDVLIVAGVEYPIKEVERWSDRRNASFYLRLIVEELRL